jgi:FKBP-type peptidyl-prolyl cis-trans isomerase SlyD
VTDGTLKVSKDIVVSMDYVLNLKGERKIDRSESDSPLEYLHGYNNIIPGLEKELEGLIVGDERDVIVPPNLGYGYRDPDGVVEFPRDSFPSTRKMDVGESVMMRDNENGESLRAYIKELNQDTVLLDFNHPLAGETLYFHVKISDLRAATDEELAHGHVHDASHNH